MSKLSLKEFAWLFEAGKASHITGAEIQDGAFAKLWDELKQVHSDDQMLTDKVNEYLEPYLTK